MLDLGSDFVHEGGDILAGGRLLWSHDGRLGMVCSGVSWCDYITLDVQHVRRSEEMAEGNVDNETWLQ